MACKRVARHTTKQDSQLFDNIYSNLANSKEELAEELYVFFESDTFKEDFGDWIADYKLPINERTIDQKLIDENGEPRLTLDRKKAKYYYTNKEGKKVYYPNNINKLEESYSQGAIREITKILAVKFVKNRIGDNFNDFDTSTKKGTLSESIYDSISKKAKELMNSEDLDEEFKGEALNDSLDYLDEWVRHVNNYLKEIKLVYNETTETEEIINDETNTRSEKTFGVSSFERSTKDNISANVKLRLSLLVGEEKDDLFFEPKLLNFDEVYSNLLTTLTDEVALDHEDLFEIMLNKINDLSGKKPHFKSLYTNLKNSSDYIKAEFVQAFNLDRNNFIGSVININPKKEGNKIVGYETTFSVQNFSNMGGKTRAVKNNWFYNFTKNFTNEKSKVVDKNIKEFKEHTSDFIKFRKDFNIARSKESYSVKDFEKDVSKVMKKLSILGVETNQDAIGYYLDGLSLVSIPFEEQVKNLANLIKGIEYTYENINDKNVKVSSNPFDSETSLTDLAKANAFYISEGSDSSFFSVGKSKWLYSYPSYLSNRIKKWRKDPSLLRDHYNSTPYNKGSYYMEWLLGLDVEESSRDKIVKDRLSKFDVYIFNSLQEEGDASNAVGNTDMSKNDAYADLYNKTLAFKTKASKSYLNSPVPADKSTQFQLEIAKDLMVSTNARYFPLEDKIIVEDKAIKILYKYIVSEFNRIKQVKQEIETKDPSELKVHYHLGNKNGLKFQLFPSLNYDKVDPSNKDKRIKVFDSKKMGFELYDKEGNILDFNFENIENITNLEDVKSESARKLIELIETTLDSNIREMTSHLYNVGILERIDGKTVNKGFSTEIWNTYENSKGADLKAASDIFINNMISQVEYSKMFSGDVAYYKNMADYKKRIPATYTDGLQLYLRPGEESFNASVIEGVEVASPYLDELKKYLPKDIWEYYENINSTDAQAWITPERWKFLKQRLGKWSEAHDTVYSKMLGENNDPMTSEELKMAAQPLKGVYFDINDGAPVFLKYSQAVLLPDVVKGNKGLEKLLDKMTKDSSGKLLDYNEQIHELITIDGVKVGANNPVNTHNADYSIKDDFTLTKMPLKNSGWKLQQDLPTKTYKDTDIGSQIQKNIFAGIANNLENVFQLDGKEVTGEQLIENINDTITKMSDKGLRKVFKEFGITPDYKITNAERLRESLIDELKSRGAAQNVIDALESNMTTYGIAGQQEKIQNVFASMILKRVIKIQSNGGSFIQMSNYGFNKTEANGKGVRWLPWAKDNVHEPELVTNKIDNKVEIYEGFWKRSEIKENTDKVYLFGDNTDDRLNTKYEPKSTQAVIRNLDNAIGIDTKKDRGTKNSSYFTDNDFNEFKEQVDKAISKAKNSGKTIVIPKDGIGTGKAMLKEKAPKLFEYLEDQLEVLSKGEEYTLSQNGKERIRPGGVLISGSIIAKHIPNWHEYSDAELFESHKGGPPIIDKKILQSLIGYRIPNQGLASNDALEVVGILPESAGDTVVAYTGITTKTGSDFDIDKMYMMIPSFTTKRTEVGYKKAKDFIKEIDFSVDEMMEELDKEGIDYYNKDVKNVFIEEILFDSNSTNYVKEDFYKIIGKGDIESLQYDDNALENELIQQYKAVLTHPDVIVDVMTPIDFEFMENNIKALFPKEDTKDLADFNIKNEIDLKYEFIAGKAGVGITANQLVDHVRGMMANLRVVGEIKALENPKSNVKLDNEYSEEVDEKDLKEYAKLTKQSYDKVKGLKKIKIANSLSALMNAYVDIAKDSYVTRGNWTTQTANIGMMLLRSGVHPFKVNSILGQPIIRDYIDFVTNSESKIVNETSDDMTSKFLEKKKVDELGKLDNVIINGKEIGYKDLYSVVKWNNSKKDLKKKYKKITDTQIDQIFANISDISIKYDSAKDGKHVNYKLRSLNKSIKNSESVKDFELQQLSIFKDFQEWNEMSKDLVKNINASKPDVNAYGKNISALIISDNLNRLLLNGTEHIRGFDSKMSFNGLPTILQTYIENGVIEIKKIMENNPLNFITAHPTVVNTFNSVSQGLKQEQLLDQKLGDKLEKSFYTYMMSGFTPFNMDIEKKKELLNKLPDKILKYKKENKDSKSALLQELDVVVGEDNKTFITMSNRKKSPSFEGDIIIAWKDLLENDPDLGEELIKYAFLTSGLNMTMNQFYTYIPYEWFAKNNINDYITGIAEDLQQKDVDSNFFHNFFRTNVSDNQIVPNVFNNQMLEYTEGGFILKEEGVGKPYVKYIDKGTLPTGEEYETTKLFRLEGYTGNKKAIYTRTTELGYKDKKGNKVVEDAYDLEGIPTMFNKVKGLITENKDGIVDIRNRYKDIIEIGPTYFNSVVKDNIEESTSNVVNEENNEQNTPITIGDNVTFVENDMTLEGIVTRKAVSEENSFEIKTKDGYTIKDISLIQPLNDRVDIKYPEKLILKDAAGDNIEIDTLKLLELSNLQEDELLITPKPDEPIGANDQEFKTLQKQVKEFNEDIDEDVIYTADNWSKGLSKNQLNFTANNYELIHNLIDYASLDFSQNMMHSAKYLLNTLEKEYIDNNQLDLFDDNNDPFLKECKQ